jgi:prolyl oligopeptidase
MSIESKPTPPASNESSERSSQEYAALSADLRIEAYRWLENIASPEVGAWIAEENARTAEALKAAPVAALERRFNELSNVTEKAMPIPHAGKYFFMQRRPDEDFYMLYEKDSLNGEPRLVFDTQELHATQGLVVDPSTWEVSDNGKLLVCHVSEAATDLKSIWTIDVETGTVLPESIPQETYPHFLTWNGDSSGFWYYRSGSEAPPGEERYYRKLYFHEIGQPAENDRMVFGAGYPKDALVGIRCSDDRQHAYLAATYTAAPGDKQKTYERFIADPNDVEGTQVRICPDVTGLVSGFIHGGRVFLELREDTPNGKLISAPVAEAGKPSDAWETVLPETGASLLQVMGVGDKLVVHTMENAVSVLRVHRLDGSIEREIGLPSLGTVPFVITDPTNPKEFFFSFSSFATVPTSYRYDMATNEYEVIQKFEVRANLESLEVTEEWVVSKDGTRVPMFLVRRKDVPQDTETPTLFYAYGGFGKAMRPEFNPFILPFVEAGGTYALVCARGGGELGQAWYDAGRREHKQNTIDDVIAAIEHEIAAGHTNPKKVAIKGESNGGMVMSAVMLERPDLVQGAALIGVPVTNLLEHDKSTVGLHWIYDYGNPHDPAEIPRLRALSPVHTVRPGVEYPATLIHTGRKDDRVHPSHSYMFQALLEEAAAGDEDHLLLVEEMAGHGGSFAKSGIDKKHAMLYGFVFEKLGMDMPEKL